MKENNQAGKSEKKESDLPAPQSRIPVIKGFGFPGSVVVETFPENVGGVFSLIVDKHELLEVLVEEAGTEVHYLTQHLPTDKPFDLSLAYDSSLV